jgi:nitrate reductase alpha subunit
MKDVEKMVKSLVDGLKSLSKGIDAAAKRIDTVAKGSQAKAPKAKPGRRAAVKKVAVKKVAAKKAPAKRVAAAGKGDTAINSVYQIITRAKNGADTGTIKHKTGFNDKKVQNIIYKLKKQGRIQSSKKGIYTTA